MERLNKALLSSNFNFPKDLIVPTDKAMPERIMQFGEGNFLRAFIDWMIHHINQAGKFNGKVVVVQPIATGQVDLLNEQDGLFTLFLRGVEEGKVIENKEIIAAISRGINPYENWQEYIACAKNPDLRFIVSNTTEAGIIYLSEEFVEDSPLKSFPAKLTAFLYARYKHFNGDPDKGLLIFPCELIDRNGDQLKTIMLRLIEEWQLPAEFSQWIKEHNHFFNTLVDRIVTGYPRDSVDEYRQVLGYEDKLIDVGEVFHLWVIEGDQRFAHELPLKDIGLNVLWVDNLTLYRERKVRVLNGAHSMTVPVAYLCGLDTVKEAVDNEMVGKFMRRGIFNEILPTLKLPEGEKISFANLVLERFQNPFTHHRLIDISLNSISKFKARCLPSLLDYVESRGESPPMLAFSLAALMVFYKGTSIEQNKLEARRDKGEYFIMDNVDVLEYFQFVWKAYNEEDKKSLSDLVTKVLSNKVFWGLDLNKVNSLNKFLYKWIEIILDQGMKDALKKLLDEQYNYGR